MISKLCLEGGHIVTDVFVKGDKYLVSFYLDSYIYFFTHVFPEDPKEVKAQLVNELFFHFIN